MKTNNARSATNTFQHLAAIAAGCALGAIAGLAVAQGTATQPLTPNSLIPRRTA
jgi:hypothetical protein